MINQRILQKEYYELNNRIHTATKELKSVASRLDSWKSNNLKCESEEFQRNFKLFEKAIKHCVKEQSNGKEEGENHENNKQDVPFEIRRQSFLVPNDPDPIIPEFINTGNGTLNFNLMALDHETNGELILAEIFVPKVLYESIRLTGISVGEIVTQCLFKMLKLNLLSLPELNNGQIIQKEIENGI